MLQAIVENFVKFEYSREAIIFHHDNARPDVARPVKHYLGNNFILNKLWNFEKSARIQVYLYTEKYILKIIRTKRCNPTLHLNPKLFTSINICISPMHSMKMPWLFLEISSILIKQFSSSSGAVFIWCKYACTIHNTQLNHFNVSNVNNSNPTWSQILWMNLLLLPVVRAKWDVN